METDARYTKADLEKIGARWIERIQAREKDEEDWIDAAEEAEVAFTADEKSESSSKGYDVPEFNVLHSNVETIVPAIFNSSPKPDIRPRHNNRDDAAKQVADIFERAILTQIDDNALDAEVEFTAQDSFLAGRGITRVKFDADEVPAQYAEVVDPMTGMPVTVEVSPASVTNERVLFENVSWRDYRFGPCKRHKDRPWEAFRHCISDEELARITDEDIGSLYVDAQKPTEREELDVDVWEIWSKEDRKVYFVVESSGKVISVRDDPLGLKNFFTVPGIVQPIKATHNTKPVCPYSVYKTLAEELSEATRRINAIMKGLRVRGIIAGDTEAMELLAELDDNQFVPAPNPENLAALGGLDRAVMWWPIETAIAVLRELYAQREQTKMAIYEITGISDIIRGQGAASETATAQQIKTQWGALRIKKMQRLLERHIRDLFRVAAEIMSQHFSFETLGRAAGIPITPEMAPLLGRPFDHYRIDIESDSTVRADMTQGRQEMAQFLEGTAQFFNTMAPVVAQAPAAAGPIVEMYAAFARQFNLGKQAEDALDQFAEMAKKVASQPRENPEAEAQKAEMQLRMQEMQGKMGLEVEKLKLQAQNLRLDGELKGAELQLKNRELGIKGDQVDLEEAKAEMDAVARVAEMEMEQEQQRAVKIGND